MIDVGAGDGRLVATAASDPDTFAVAVDANSAALREGLRRARKAKITNALFVAAAAEMLPRPFSGTATEVRVHYPWGSLLTSLVTGSRQVVNGIAALLRPGGRLTVLVSVIEATASKASPASTTPRRRPSRHGWSPRPIFLASWPFARRTPLTSRLPARRGASASAPAPSVGLAAVAALRDLVEELEELHVDNARRLGWSRQAIADGLGITRQSVHKKHHVRRGRRR